MPRYVILDHQCPEQLPRGSHFDLMLQLHQTLITWAIASLPTLVPHQTAERLPDHRLEYLEYEGPVSRNRGFVTRWDQGTYRFLQEPMDQNQLPNSFQLVVEGKQLSGTLHLSLIHSTQWQLEYTPHSG